MSFELLSLETVQDIAKDYGYWAVFFGIALENAGVPIPGETITLVGGFGAGSGELNYWVVLCSAIAGAVLGDNCGYWIGKIGGWPLLLRIGGLVRITEAQLTEAKTEFRKNAAKAVFFGRFVAILRIFAGPMAGIVQMPYPKFLLFNFAGASIWASVMVSLSYFCGRLIPLELLISSVSKFAIVALILVIGSIVVPKWFESRRQKLGMGD
ncbi:MULTISPECIES: DedA family protein [unclassified Moorena]|uniref:DedA family protein n=1 Tax=unclassified Moorena TaxID=2683338 RepID=UPI0013FFA74B|nr:MULTISPECIES: DedA family protein [unclassified Moorena]NEO13427.1 DedA family protein [Moorena sp. SIO3E8]NEQ00762.1 DedA family protein [Moorena sp. SIO3F7]